MTVIAQFVRVHFRLDITDNLKTNKHKTTRVAALFSLIGTFYTI